MTGYLLGDKNLTDMALYGSKKDRTGGYLRQLELLFSPDGFYTEGAYYVRYALMPFVGFAQVIENNEPSLKIFEFRNRIIEKAVFGALQLTYTNNTAYRQYGHDPGLLWVARQHGEVMLNGAGLAVAQAIQETKVLPPFGYASVEYTDGGDGTEGGLGILRAGSVDDQSLLLMKYTGHGLSHGHYDKLGILYYDQGREILQDYGAARFINVESKFGGRYLPETKTWTRQTVAHNTVVVDGESHFGGKEKVSEKHHGERHFFQSDPSLQAVSATVADVTPGVRMQRTVAMIPDAKFVKPLIVDIIRVVGDKEHQYDLPFYYLGHVVNSNVKYTAAIKNRAPLGEKNGYEHLWVEAEGPAPSSASVSWLNGNRYYTLTTAADAGTQLYFTRIGANDPDFNLRPEPGLLFRRKAKETVFATVLQPHGVFDPVKEFSVGARPPVTGVQVLASTEEGTVVELTGPDGFRWVFMTTNKPADAKADHKIAVGGRTYQWKGNVGLERE
jgi:hypothetical protein